jgi:hypothetical protein
MIHAADVARALAGLTLLATLSAAEPILLLDGAQPPPPAGHDTAPLRELSIALPGIGGEAVQSVFLAGRWQDGAWRGQPTIRAWQQQRGLQPSQISKQSRKLVDETVLVRDGDGWRVQLIIEIQTPAQARQPRMLDWFAVRGQLTPHAGDPPVLRLDRSTPPWRRNDLPLVGTMYRGDLEVKHRRVIGEGAQAQTSERTVASAVWLADEPHRTPDGPWSRSGDGALDIAGSDRGLHFSARLAEVLTDAGEGVAAHRLWAQRRDLSACNALLVTYRADAPRVPVRVGIQLEHRPGVWTGSSFPLAGGERSVLLPFAGFHESGGFNPDHHLRADSVGGLAVTLSSGHAAGATGIEIRRIEAIHDPSLGLAWGSQADSPVEVTLDPAATRRVNGVAGISPALFGVHIVGQPDRKDPARREAILAALRDAGIGGIRGLEHTGFGGVKGAPGRGDIPALAAAAGVAPEDTIDCYTHGLFDYPPWADNLAGYAQRVAEFHSALATAAWRPEAPGNGMRNVEVLNEPFMWARHINKPGGALQDPTQHNYLPAKLSADAYIAIFNAAAAAAKPINPHLRLGGPCSAGFSSDDWRHLTGFVMPVVRGCPQLDAVVEHHYQGRGQQFAAEFEVFQALATAEVGKRLPIWNTECNDLADKPGAQEDPEDPANAQVSLRRGVYQLAEILAHLRFGPDHTRARMVHALWGGQFRKVGEAEAFKLMAGLRGDLMPVGTGDDSILAAAARRGETGALVVYNDGHRARRIVVAGLAAWVPSRSGRLMALAGREVTTAALSLEVSDGALAWVLPPLSAVAIDLAGLPVARWRDETVRYARSAADPLSGGLWRLAGGSQTGLVIPEAQGAPSALRLVAEDLDAGEATITLGAVRIPLPHSGNGPRRVIEIPLPAGADAAQPRIEVSAGADGFRLCSLSAVWISTAP